jgi:hypothetical protein
MQGSKNIKVRTVQPYHCTMPQDFPATHLTWLLITPSTYLSAYLQSNPLLVHPQVSISHPHPAKMKPIPLHTMKAYGVIRLWPHASVTSELDGVSGKLQAPTVLRPKKVSLVTFEWHQIRSWWFWRSGSGKGFYILQPMDSHYIYCAILAPSVSLVLFWCKSLTRTSAVSVCM